MTTAGAFSHTFDKADFAGVDFSQVETIRLGSFEAVGGNYVDVPTGGDLIIGSLENNTRAGAATLHRSSLGSAVSASGVRIPTTVVRRYASSDRLAAVRSIRTF